MSAWQPSNLSCIPATIAWVVCLQSFGVGTAAVGMTISAYALARLMMNLPAGILADRHGRKLLLVWGPALTAIGTALHLSLHMLDAACMCHK